ncbi:DNA-binding transcriptional regulator DsdC [Pseudomonas sp. SDI]|uniref:DNA-binding transcriptional regulator DsdC n=1 Tax=Pseudomonas sp. SDI TaxID=2170734 RepID=UPI000DE6A0C1|nr:DNA-binding transcriptional regulator DsdC [Pseudomonas sp. SDI]PWB31406.1 DNA-binding transcriptional regulator DsdC [Pseudomonas sp. SDI]
MLNLPPRLGANLNSAQFANLHTFLVAARHLSFALAAEELCLSPSAVSHRIARLEQALALRLFERLTRRIRLTREGEQIYAILGGALTELSQALQQAPAAEFSGSVALYARPSIAQCWLVPRLADFHRRYPDIALDVRVGNDPVDFRTQHVDLALLYADGRFPGLVSQPLMSEALAPVCSPRYAEQHGLLASPENLRQCTLLHDARAWENAAFDAEWQLWARHCGLREALPTQALTFDRSDLCVTAAINHAGVTIGRQRLVQRSLDQGELLPFGGFSQTGRYDYFLVHPRRVPMPGRVQVLIDWLQECARQSG